MSDDNCTAITPECPVELSTYGYLPNLGANAFFVAFFGVCCLINLGLGVKYKTWTYMIAVSLGCLVETIGYIGRLIMRDNPFADTGFITQICCLIIAPAFNSAAIYLTLKHIVLCFGEEFSPIKARWYTWIFVGADILSLVLQAAGGAIASMADDEDMLQVGDNLMMAGVSWQVASLFFFAVMTLWYVGRRRRGMRRVPLTTEARTTLGDTKFRLFAAGVAIAWLTIFVRCVYRIIEMSGGWGNDIMRHELSFIIFEGVMLVIAVFCQTAFHPGFCFPRLGAGPKVAFQPLAKEEQNASSTSLDELQTRQYDSRNNYDYQPYGAHPRPEA